MECGRQHVYWPISVVLGLAAVKSPPPPPSAHTHSGFAVLLEQGAGNAGGIVLALLGAALDHLCSPPPVPVARLFGRLVGHGSCVGGPFVARHPGQLTVGVFARWAGGVGVR